MIVDFKEILEGNRGGGEQDQFELFARDFFAALDYEIIVGPSRGADDGRDLVIVEHMLGERSKRWVVSCKHYAHSGRAIPSRDETDVSDRVNRWKCDAFLAFYSTIASSALARKFDDYRGRFDIDMWDRGKIEGKLVTDPRLRFVLMRYFPKSYRHLSKNYIWEKLFMSVYSLTLGSEPIQERLSAAYLEGLCRLKPDFLPDEMKVEFVRIMHALTSVEPVSDEGSLDATLKVMSTEEADSIAASILGMYDRYRGDLIYRS